MFDKNKNEESRPEMFRLLYQAAYEDLAEQLQRRNHVRRTVCWTGGATRKRVRKLAREQARLEMRGRRKKVN